MTQSTINSMDSPRRSFPVLLESYPELTFLTCGMGALPAMFMMSWCCVSNNLLVLLGVAMITMFVLNFPLLFIVRHSCVGLFAVPPLRETIRFFPSLFAYLAGFLMSGMVAVFYYLFLTIFWGVPGTAPHGTFVDPHPLIQTGIAILNITLGITAVVAGCINLFYTIYLSMMVFLGIISTPRIGRMKELGYQNLTMSECLLFLSFLRDCRAPLMAADDLAVIPGVENNGPSLLAFLKELQVERAGTH